MEQPSKANISVKGILQKGGVPAAPSCTATLLRLSTVSNILKELFLSISSPILEPFRFRLGVQR
jgi:hypothetical protein